MNGGRGLAIAVAAAFIVGCSAGLMGGILFARFALPGLPGFGHMHGPSSMFGHGPGGPRGPERLLPMLDDALRLTADQHARIVAILDRTRHAGDAVRDSMEADISRVLTPDQRLRWKEMEQRFERSRRLRTRGGPPVGLDFPSPGERTDTMTSKWWSMGVAAMLAVAPVGVAYAQEAPPPREERVAPGDQWARDDDAIANDADDVDLDLLAAGLPPGPSGGGGRNGPRQGAGMGRGDGDRQAFRERLNLTDDQRRRLADIRDRHEREVIPIQGDLRIAGLDLRKLIRADRPESRAIDAQIDRIASLRASMQKARVAGMLEARNVLTPAQQQMMREHRGMGGMRMRGRGRPMTGPESMQ